MANWLLFSVKQGHAKSFSAALGGDGETRVNLDYQLFNGVSIQLNDIKNAEEKAAKLAKLPSVKRIWPVQLIDRPNPKIEWVAGHDATNVPKVVSRADGDEAADKWPPHTMTQVDKLRAKGYTGKGIKIAVVDTGIDYTHPALGNNCFGKGCLVSFGTDFVGDAYTGNNTPHPDDDPMDCGGHGSHVAGIIAAQKNPYGFTGAAPDVTLGAYKVFGCSGQVSNDVLIAAFNKAYEDGAQIITSSIGGPSGWSEDPWSVATSRIVEKGVPCTVSAGNEGANGVFYTSTAANGKRVAAIASFDNIETPAIYTHATYDLDGGDKKDFRYVLGEPDVWDNVNLPLYALSTDTTIADDGCHALPDNTPDLSGKIVLIKRGTCTFVIKATNAAAKGAKYIMFYNNVPISASATVVEDVKQIKAAGMVEASIGANWVNSIKAGKTVNLHMVGKSQAKIEVVYVNNTASGGALSGYTSWGPTWEMDQKPQYGGPGGNILSTYPVAKGSYAVLSGTSMSCPITAGITALIAQVRGSFDPQTIEDLLSANANPQLFNAGGKFYPTLAPVPQQGGGLVQAHDAAFATTLLSPSRMSFNDTAHFVKSMDFKLSNTGKSSVTYEVSHVPALTVYSLGAGSPYVPPFPNEGVETSATLAFSSNKITLSPGESKSVTVSPTPPAGLDPKRLGLWSGYVAINGTDGTSLSLPYQGLTGSLHDSTVLVDDDTWIADSLDDDNKPLPNNSTFVLPAPGTATGADHLPGLVINLALGSRLITAHLVPLTTCPPKNTFEYKGFKSIGQPAGFPALYSPRGAGKYPFTGQLADGNYAPPGKYKVVVRALHLFGDEKNAKEYDVSVSPAFKFSYK